MIEFTTQVLPSMALQVDVQLHQKSQPVNSSVLYAFISSGPSWACKHNGKIVALGGHVPQAGRRTVVWGLISADAAPAMYAMTRRIKKEIESLRVDFDRVEAYTHRNHEAGHRWLKMLGFKHEFIMRKFYEGEDYSMYAKVK